ncbi:hypothetical protein VPH35_043944 [Triticum aestivum]|uniref:Glabrous enhancer-binding protein-like DBD domain-containing protein n=3 Tax=Triticum TaxID=4564 RepID=A0A9R0RFL8_TRITD|nr:probable transcription factor At3g04930 [Triticum aestivum]VAH59591.1 unnamed protein product [Triticum turgidum subsp. durum]
MASAAPSRSRSSSSADQDEEGTDSDASNDSPPPAAQQAPPPPFPDSSAPPPPAPAFTDPAGAGAAPPPPPQGASAAEDSRRLFQRLWTDEEELLILRGFLEFTSRRGTAFASHQYDTGPFYEEIRRKLSFDFSKNQLIEKLRRLKKKYRVCATRVAAQGAAFAFKSAHEGAIYDVARHIWRPAFKRDGAGGDASDEDDINPAAAAAAAAAAAVTEPPAAVEEGGGGGASAHTPRGRGPRRGGRKRAAQEIEAPIFPATPAPMLTDAAHEPAITAFESSVPVIAQPPPVPAAPLPPYPVTANGPTEADVRSILSPLLKELISSVAVPGQTGLGLGLGMEFGGADILGAGLGVAGLSPRAPGDEKWRQQQILELEVYLKRLELVREQVMTALQELRSSGS